MDKNFATAHDVTLRLNGFAALQDSQASWVGATITVGSITFDIVALADRRVFCHWSPVAPLL